MRQAALRIIKYTGAALVAVAIVAAVGTAGASDLGLITPGQIAGRLIMSLLIGGIGYTAAYLADVNG